jgi:cytoskeletal protein CcmA (bactofilin family)
LGKGSEFEGKLNFEGAVRIDGVMKGEIISKDRLIIGESAKVEAEINVGSAVISGEVVGNITASSEVELIAPAKVTGNIKTPSLIIQKGVIFDGNCSMSGKSSKSPSSATSQEVKKD